MSKDEKLDNYGTQQEREKAIEELKEWAENHESPDLPYICLPDIGKMFTPRELARDISDETALGVFFLDTIMLEAQILGVTPSDYVKRLGKKLVGRNLLLDPDKESS